MSLSVASLLQTVESLLPKSVLSSVNLEQLAQTALTGLLTGTGAAGALDAIAVNAATIVAPQYAPLLVAAIDVAKEVLTLVKAAKSAPPSSSAA